MEHAIARMIMEDFRAFQNDKTGTQQCPQPHQVNIAKKILAGEPVSHIPGANSDRVEPYLTPSPEQAAAITGALSVHEPIHKVEPVVFEPPPAITVASVTSAPTVKVPKPKAEPKPKAAPKPKATPAKKGK